MSRRNGKKRSRGNGGGDDDWYNPQDAGRSSTLIISEFNIKLIAGIAVSGLLIAMMPKGMFSSPSGPLARFEAEAADVFRRGAELRAQGKHGQ